MAKPALDVRTHNIELLNQLQVGDLIQFPRSIYSHWAVYIGEGEVVHLSGEDDDGIDGKLDSSHLFTICGCSIQNALVRIDRLLDVAGDCKAIQNNSKDKKFTPLPGDQIVGSALTKLGKVSYNVFYSNCEHFASWCRYGERKSDQADKVLNGLSILTTLGATVGVLFGLARGAKLVDRKKSLTQQ